jgi:hypothetical protein
MEIKDSEYVYKLFQNRLPILFISCDIDKFVFKQIINTHTMDENNVDENIKEYHFAFLFKCLSFDIGDAFVEETDFSDLVYMLNPYIKKNFNIYNAPYVRNRRGHKKWIQEFYVVKQARNFTNNKIAFIPGYVGNGEILIGMPIISKFIQNNINSDLYIFNSSISVNNILKQIFPECHHKILTNNEKLSQYLEKIYGDYEYQTIYSQFMKPRSVCRNKHSINLFVSICEINESIESLVNRFNVKHFLESSYNSYVDEFFNTIAKKDFEYIIATQFFTDSSTSRCWSIRKVEEFCKLCKDMNIGIANLSVPNENTVDMSNVFTMDNVFDLSHFTILDLSQVIYQCNAFVGIDSSFGHLAGLLNKPSITLWEDNSPILFQTYPVGYRVIRNNFSFSKKEKNQDNIDPSIVISKTIDILTGIYSLKREFITFKDSTDMLDYVTI